MGTKVHRFDSDRSRVSSAEGDQRKCSPSAKFPHSPSLRSSVEVLERGRPLVIFPEGTRRSGPVVENLFEGAAYVAARAGVPVVPVGIGGSERMMRKGKKLPRPTKVHIVVGEPIVVSAEGGRASRSAVHRLTGELQEQLQSLFDAAQKRAAE